MMKDGCQHRPKDKTLHIVYSHVWSQHTGHNTNNVVRISSECNSLDQQLSRRNFTDDGITHGSASTISKGQSRTRVKQRQSQTHPTVNWYTAAQPSIRPPVASAAPSGFESRAKYMQPITKSMMNNPQSPLK